MSIFTTSKRPQLLLIIIIILLSPVTLKAKDDSLKDGRKFRNSFYINACYQRFPGIYERDYLFVLKNLVEYDFGSQLGAYFERNIYKGLIIGCGYAEWTTLLDLTGFYGSSYLARGSATIDQVGAIEWREYYKMIDIYAGYQYRVGKKHQLEASLGYSKTWGDNWIIDSIYEFPFHSIMELRQEKGSYSGFIAQTQYRYFLLKERVAVGINIRARKYFGLYNYQLDYGYFIAVNF